MLSRYLSPTIALLILASIDWMLPATAQLPLEADNTLGDESSVVVPNGGDNFEIDGGAARGGNLFHSFEEFNINEGGSVYFRNPAVIDNILSRVTGENASNILGTLGVLGDANLFLLNPNGIIFGPNAQLDISGSFYASTGDRFSWADGSEFRATNPNAPPLLSINVPLGVQYGTPAGDITNEGVLFAEDGLGLHARSLDLQGQLWSGGPLTLLAEDTLRIRDSIDTPFIAVAQGRMALQGNETVDIFALSHPDSGFWSGGNMVLRSANPVGGDAQYSSGGNFRIEQLDQSLGTLFSPYDPVIRSLGDVRFDAYQGTSLHILAAGDVVVSNYVQILGAADPLSEEALVEPGLRLSNGDPFPIDGFLEPTLDIRAGVDPDVIGVNQLPATGDFFGTLDLTPPPVDSANIEVGTILMGFVASEELPPDFLQGRILLTNQYAPDPTNTLPGDIRIFDTQVDLPDNPDLNGVAIRAESQQGGGLVAIDSRGDIDLDGRINANAVVNDAGIFDADGGDVTLLANGDITIRPNPETGLPNNINSSGRLGGTITLLSRGGDILLEGPTLRAIDQFIPAGLSSESFGQTVGGIGGDINVTAETGNIRILNDANVSTQISGSGERGGAIALNAPLGDIRLQDNAFVGSSTFGEANAGNISVTTGSNGRVVLSNNSQIRGLVEPNGVGRSADVTITTGTLRVESSQISTGLLREITEDLVDPTTGEILVSAGLGGRGESGDIEVTATNAVILQGITTQGFSSGLFSNSGRGAVGPAGDVQVVAGNRVSIADGAAISTLSDNPSPGGNVTVITDIFEVVRGGRIVSTSREGGAAGTVLVSAGNRIEISGEDPNYQERRDRIDDYLTNDPLGQTDELEDVLGLRDDELSNLEASGIFVNASEAATSGNLILLGGSVEVSDGAEVLSISNNANTDSFSNLAISATDGSLVIDGITRVSSSNFGTGFAGDITLNATERVRIDNGAGIFSQGQLGRILIGANGQGTATPPRRVLIGDRASIVTTNLNETPAGAILITASEQVSVIGDPDSERALTSIESNGNFGRIAIGQPVESPPTSFSELTSVSPNRVRIENALISTDNDADPTADDNEIFGNAGNISVQANENLRILDSEVTSETFGDGNAGNISIGAGDRLRISEGSIIQSRTREGTAGDAGFITLAAIDTINLTNASELSTATSGTGNAGNITLLAGRNVILSEDALLFSNVNENAGSAGNPVQGGNILIGGQRLSMSGGAQIQVQVNEGAVGNGGTVFIASDRLVMRGENDDDTGTAIFSSVEAGAEGQGGTIIVGRLITRDGITTGFRPIDQVALSNGAQFLAQTEGINGSNAGAVFVIARDISLDGFARVTLDDGSVVTRSTSAFARVGSEAEGNGGVVLLGGGLRFNAASDLETILPAETISLTNGAQILAETLGNGDAGQALISADRILLSGSGGGIQTAILTRVEPDARGTAGEVLLSGRLEFADNQGNFSVLSPADSITLLDGAQVRSETAGTNIDSNAGDVRLVGDRILIGGTGNNEPSGVIARVEPGARGTGGSILVIGRTSVAEDGSVRVGAAESIILRGGAQLQAQTAGRLPSSSAGNVLLVGDRITFRGLGRGRNAAGDRTILPSGVITRVEPGSQGTGGDIGVIGQGLLNSRTNRTTVQPAQRVSLLDGAQLQAQTDGTTRRADAGDVFVVANNVEVDGITNNIPSGISTSVGDGARGDGGAIFIGGRLITDGDLGFEDDTGFTQANAAQSLSIGNGAQLLTQTAGRGNAGNVYIFSETVDLDGFVDGLPSAIFSGVDQGTGRGGNIFMTGTGEFLAPDVTAGANRASRAIASEQNAQNPVARNQIVFNDDDSISVNGGFVSRSPIEEFRIADGAIVSVSSFGLDSIGQDGAVDPDSVAGNIFIHAQTLDMDNNRINLGLENERGIFAETGIGNSGNIDLAIEDLLLLRGSTRISTSAGTLAQPGDGGSISITTDDEGFVIAEPFGNNDITSNSFFGAGGEVEITAEQILGLFFRSSDDLRELLDTDDPAELDTERLPSSDVTALSQSDSSLDGEVIFNVIGTDPTQGLVELPAEVVDAADQIGQVCPTGPGAAEQLGRFVVTGRGGISPSPLEVLDDPDITVDWLEDGTPTIEETNEPIPQSQSQPPALVEADGWTRSEEGQIQLVATQATSEPGIGGELHPCP
ncbi:two-partner secretion domain-containing protein [Vacuolonema iberomarrocanum]|uniref:two-partner secretion domain-containing protein n=1 Tax=Vacuolonema iberomarrocanum TaxID=3454632 RepID=UPI0019EA5425|nr:filamentous hemagglutinin N-terminal domain-containing protein [filamentous cyanobacterium LEGE 07170]